MRQLREREKDLISFLLSLKSLEIDISNLAVEDYPKTNSNSIWFKGSKPMSQRKNQQSLVLATFLDNDNIPISVHLSVDSDGELYELDIWKVDFSEINTYPCISTFKELDRPIIGRQ